MLQYPADDICVQRHEAILTLSALSTLWQSPVSFAVLDVASEIVVKSEEVLEHVLDEYVIGLFCAVVGKKTTRKEVTCITAEHTSGRPVVEIRVVGDCVIPPVSSRLCKHAHRQNPVFIGVIVNSTEKGHVHRLCVTGFVQAIARKRKRQTQSNRATLQDHEDVLRKCGFISRMQTRDNYTKKAGQIP